jgi:hypothetical protein
MTDVIAYGRKPCVLVGTFTNDGVAIPLTLASETNEQSNNNNNNNNNIFKMLDLTGGKESEPQLRLPIQKAYFNMHNMKFKKFIRERKLDEYDPEYDEGWYSEDEEEEKKWKKMMEKERNLEQERINNWKKEKKIEEIKEKMILLYHVKVYDKTKKSYHYIPTELISIIGSYFYAMSGVDSEVIDLSITTNMNSNIPLQPRKERKNDNNKSNNKSNNRSKKSNIDKLPLSCFSNKDENENDNIKSIVSIVSIESVVSVDDDFPTLDKLKTQPKKNKTKQLLINSNNNNSEIAEEIKRQEEKRIKTILKNQKLVNYAIKKEVDAEFNREKSKYDEYNDYDDNNDDFFY